MLFFISRTAPLLPFSGVVVHRLRLFRSRKLNCTEASSHKIDNRMFARRYIAIFSQIVK